MPEFTDMVREAIEVGVVVERRKLKSPWAEFSWHPVAVLPEAPAAAPWTRLEQSAETVRFYAGASWLEFFSSDTIGYRDNLASGAPQLWVALREVEAEPGVTLLTVTADPAEGEALTEPGTDIVEQLPMPSSIAERLASFVALHHVDRAFVKRQRDRADPEALAHRRPTIASGDDKS
jgi:Protein of unknown function (DUF3305)